MDKCFACSNDAEYMLPCYHKICSICLNDIIHDGVCLCYPDDKYDKQCLTTFKQEDVILICKNDNVISELGDVCSIHNEPYEFICNNDHIYCDKCGDDCNNSCISECTLEEWKNNVLMQMNKFSAKLNIKINGLNCAIELILKNNNYQSIIKQIEDIIPSLSSDAT